jgi:soluble lytic murein transglycosylase
MRLKNYSAALKFAAESPESGQRHLLMGVAELRRGRHAEAEDLLGRAVRSYPLLADYALYYQAAAARKAGRSPESVLLLKTLQKGYPDSPLLRRSLLLEADTLFENGEFGAAEPVYQKFIEQYPLGSDALQASYRLAVCREKKGDAGGAAALLRSLWLNSPASTQATKAEDDLKRLAAAGTAIKPYTSQELYKRAATIFEQRRYEQAVTALAAISTKDEKRDFGERIELKTGQALLKAKQYQDAEQRMKELSRSDSRDEVRSEAAYLMARAIEKSGRDEDAFAAYSAVAETFPESAVADNALLDAAFIRKFQNRPKEAIELFDSLLENYPKTSLKQRATWESGWAHYLAGNLNVAAVQFKKLFETDDYRERALFWHGRATAAAGDRAAAEASLSLLRKEFPFGFYALSVQESTTGEVEEAVPVLSGASPELLPLPEGYERVKGLIALGLIEDASTELAAGKKKLAKGKGDAGLARLYLELGNYNGAMGLYTASMLQSPPGRQVFETGGNRSEPGVRSYEG